MTIPNVWKNKKCSKPPTRDSSDLFETTKEKNGNMMEKAWESRHPQKDVHSL